MADLSCRSLGFVLAWTSAQLQRFGDRFGSLFHSFQTLEKNTAISAHFFHQIAPVSWIFDASSSHRDGSQILEKKRKVATCDLSFFFQNL